ncbi:MULTISPECIES: hypothetical protein [Streptomyces]|nr:MULTISPECIES: hypothetical protein [Streptomyces]
MEQAKSQLVAQAAEIQEIDVADLVDPSAIVQSEDVEQEECYTF